MLTLTPELLSRHQLERRIEEAYQCSGNSVGWRFLYSPPSVIAGAKVAFIGLNPGGNSRPISHAEFAMKSGSAYCDERWGNHLAGLSPLQTQVRALFALLGIEPAEVLAGNYIPFRSPNWNSLQNKQFALSFARDLWADILKATQPKIIITMGNPVRQEIAKILRIDDMVPYPTGWGNIKAWRGWDGVSTLIGLPHLSRFRIMNRPASTAAVNTIFQGLIDEI